MLMTARTSKLRAISKIVGPANIIYGGSMSSQTFGLNTCNCASTAANRYLVIVFCYSTSGSVPLTAAYVDFPGNSCSKLAAFNQSTFSIEIWITDAPYPTNTTATINATPTSGSYTDVGVSVFQVYGLASNLISGSAQSTTTDGGVMTLAVQASGVAVGGCILIGGGKPQDGVAFTWVGLTEDYDKQVISGALMTGAASANTATTTNLSVSCTKAAGTTIGAMCLALR